MAAVVFSVGPLVSWGNSSDLTYCPGLRARLLFPKLCDFSTSPIPLLVTESNCLIHENWVHHSKACNL